MWATRRSPSRRPGAADRRRAGAVPCIGGVRLVLPEPAADVSLDELYGVRPAPPSATGPWVGLCMIASLDGSTVVDGRSGGLGNADRHAPCSAPCAGPPT